MLTEGWQTKDDFKSLNEELRATGLEQVWIQKRKSPEWLALSNCAEQASIPSSTGHLPPSHQTTQQYHRLENVAPSTSLPQNSLRGQLCPTGTECISSLACKARARDSHGGTLGVSW